MIRIKLKKLLNKFEINYDESWSDIPDFFVSYSEKDFKDYKLQKKLQDAIDEKKRIKSEIAYEKKNIIFKKRFFAKADGQNIPNTPFATFSLDPISKTLLVKK